MVSATPPKIQSLHMKLRTDMPRFAFSRGKALNHISVVNLIQCYGRKQTTKKIICMKAQESQTGRA